MLLKKTKKQCLVKQTLSLLLSSSSESRYLLRVTGGQNQCQMFFHMHFRIFMSNGIINKARFTELQQEIFLTLCICISWF